MMKLGLKDFKKRFQVMAIAHQIFIIWPSDKDNVNIFIYLCVLIVCNMHCEMLPLVGKSSDLKARRSVVLISTYHVICNS